MLATLTHYMAHHSVTLHGLLLCGLAAVAPENFYFAAIPVTSSLKLPILSQTFVKADCMVLEFIHLVQWD